MSVHMASMTLNKQNCCNTCLFPEKNHITINCHIQISYLIAPHFVVNCGMLKIVVRNSHTDIWAPADSPLVGAATTSKPANLMVAEAFRLSVSNFGT